MNGFDQVVYCRLMEAADTLAAGRAIPLELRELCSQIGVRIERAEIGTAKALLVDATNSPRILLPHGGTDCFSCWERFLIAHELGHLVLHAQKVPRPNGTGEYWNVERLCDAFARRLLVPEHRFRREGKARTNTAIQRFGLTRYIEKAAQVTWQAAAMRVADWHPDSVFLQLQTERDGSVRVSFSSTRREMGRKLKPDLPLLSSLLFPHRSASHFLVEKALLEPFPSLMTASSCVAVVGKAFFRLAAITLQKADNRTELRPTG